MRRKRKYVPLGNYHVQRGTTMQEAGPVCPIETLFRQLSGSWTMSILWHLNQEGPLRFGMLRRLLAGISTKVLTQRLRMLEAESLIYRDHNPTIPPQVTYSLTPKGGELACAFGALAELAQKWEGATAPDQERRS
ncbi:winged helix-turn-helix transcriptional regulator [Roseibium aggregatum]|jgi:DNA-binding HxlR family transcriptional regulator|uniref:winged helix-turn-helix transcriptional regulator n=2 Tax=Roseibium aggregatum TaxID=187304 RepID=UPI001E5F775F|nr:helix-turn-helix domain-containing protein [Roseibium aggregatum]